VRPPWPHRRIESSEQKGSSSFSVSHFPKKKKRMRRPAFVSARLAPASFHILSRWKAHQHISADHHQSAHSRNRPSTGTFGTNLATMVKVDTSKVFSAGLGKGGRIAAWAVAFVAVVRQ
jgi:hypothetical protein